MACRDQTFSRANEWHSLDCVKVIQALLDQEQGDHLLVDGFYGPLTEEAVKRFQEAHGLTVDGIVGPETWAVLDPAPTGRRVVAVAPLAVDAPAYKYLVDIEFAPPGMPTPVTHRLPIGLQEDTGAFTWIISESIAAQVGIQKGQTIQVSGVDNTPMTVWTAVADVYIGGVLFQNTEGVIAPDGTPILWGARFSIERGFGIDINPKKGTLTYYVED